MRSPEIPERFLNQLARDKRVSEGELEALKLALRKRKSKDIAKQLDISEAAARKRLGEVYKKFGIKGKGPGKLASLEAKLGARLVEYDRELTDELVSEITGELAGDRPSSRIESVIEIIAAERSPEKINPGQETSDRVATKQPRETKTTYDWGDAPTLNSFRGRREPLNDLERWIAEPTTAPKLLAICGIGGIGKSYLARRLAETVGERFKKVVWLAVEANQSPQDLLRSLQKKLQLKPPVQPQPDHSTLPLSRLNWADAQISSHQLESDERLIKQLVVQIVQQRALIVLDGFDSVFKSYSNPAAAVTKPHPKKTKESAHLEKLDCKDGGKDDYWLDNLPSDRHRAPTFHVTRQQQASLYKDGFESYGKLINALKECERGKLEQTSCLILTSREKPREFLSFSANDANGRLYMLEGLSNLAAEAMLKEFRLRGDDKDYQEFVARYCGHPMALRLATNMVKEVFRGSIRDFLEQDISVFDDLRSLLKTQFKRLPPTEKEVMYWLAINHQPCTLEDLKEDIVAEDHRSNVLYTLRSLQRRSLIQVKQTESITSFRLHPIVASYVLNRFIRAVFLDLMRQDLQLFNDHALMKADAEDGIREFQLKHIVHPILERLRNYCKSLHQVEVHLSGRLDEFRAHNPHRLGYAGGNFVNLLVQLAQGEALCGKDFSQMTIWQAYLQKVQLREVSFNRCELDRSVFTETLSDVMAVAFSSSPSSSHLKGSLRSQPLLLAAGDANGTVHLWPTPISRPISRPVGRASSQGFTPNSAQKCAPKCAQWVAHSGWVRATVFVPNQPLLVTGGDDNWLRLWRLPANQPEGSIQPTQVWQKSAHDWVHAIAVSSDGAIIASGGDDKITLYRTRNGRLINRFADQIAESMPTQAACQLNSAVSATESDSACITQKNRIRALAFSPDAQWLASGGDDGIVRIWPIDKLTQSAESSADLSAADIPQPRRLIGHKDKVQTLSFSPDSQQIVSGGADKTLRVWDVESGQLKKRFDRPVDQVRAIAISPSGLLASSGDDCQIMLWDLNTLRHIQDISTGQSRIWSVAFQQQGDKLLLCAGGDKQALMLWQIDAALKPSLDASLDAALDDSLDVSLIVANTLEKSIIQKPKQQFSSVEVRPVRTYRGYTNGIRAVAFLSGDRIVGGGDSGDLSV
ncbi:MAG: AAA family ATPase, partial [Phormidesmis sp.]